MHHQNNRLMTGVQVREARRLLGISGTRLNSLAGLPAGTIEGFEKTGHVRGPTTIDPAANRFEAIRQTLETAGIEFIEQNEGPSVRLRQEALQ